MNNYNQKNIGEIVADDYRTASVFKKHKIDFCCNGNRSINEVCEQKSINQDSLMKELENVSKQSNDASIDYDSWDLDLLAEYIEKKHHRYVRNRIPEMKTYLAKIAKVHGRNHPELLEVEQLFLQSANELTNHMHKEEMVLFPYVKKLANNTATSKPHFGTVQNPIRMMMHEHDNEGNRFRTIEKLTNNYTPPADACNTYKVAFSLLKEFEDDLHLHIHLENNILFPKAIEAENSIQYEQTH